MNYQERLDEFLSLSERAWQDLVKNTSIVLENDQKSFDNFFNENEKVTDFLENAVNNVLDDQSALGNDLKNLDNEKLELSRLENAQIEAESQNKILEEKLHSMEIELDKAKVSFKENNLSNQTKRRKLESQKSDIKQALQLYSKYLGLEIRTLQDHRTQYIFHDNDNLKIDKNASFVIIRLVDETYEVTDSEPNLPNRKDFEQQLNATNNLAGFIQCIRRVLKQEKEMDLI